MTLPDLGSWSPVLAAFWSGFFAWMIARERRIDRQHARIHGKPPESKVPGVGPIALLIGGLLLAGYQSGREYYVKNKQPQPLNNETVISALELCGSECTSKPGCKCSPECRCSTFDRKPIAPLDTPDNIKLPKKKKLPQQSNRLVINMNSLPMAGEPWGWFIEPISVWNYRH